jgi:hypothetical protein
MLRKFVFPSDDFCSGSTVVVTILVVKQFVYVKVRFHTFGDSGCGKCYFSLVVWVILAL